MNTHTPTTVKYFTDFKRVEPIDVDSSRLRQFKFCPKSYFLRYVLGYTLPTQPIYLTWGSTVHKFREALEDYHDAGHSHEVCFGLAVRDAMKVWGNTKDPGPDDKKFGYMTKSRLSDLLLFMQGEWVKEKNEGSIKVVAKEQPFNIQLPNGMWISGKPDQIILWNGRLWGRDFKTTSKDLRWYVRELAPNDQFARYTYVESALSGQRVNGQVVDIYYLSKDKGPIFKREPVTYSPDALEKWLEEQDFWKAALDKARETDNYPQVEANCKFCPFHEVCQAATLKAQEYILKAKYKFEVWDNAKKDT